MELKEVYLIVEVISQTVSHGHCEDVLKLANDSSGVYPAFSNITDTENFIKSYGNNYWEFKIVKIPIFEQTKNK